MGSRTMPFQSHSITTVWGRRFNYSSKCRKSVTFRSLIKEETHTQKNESDSVTRNHLYSIISAPTWANEMRFGCLHCHVKKIISLWFYSISLGFTGSHWFLLGFSWFYRVLPDFTGIYLVLLGFTGLYWVLLGCTALYWDLLGFTGFYWVLLGFTGFYWVLLGFTGFYWVLLGCTGFYWVVLGCTGFYWVLLGFTSYHEPDVPERSFFP